MGLRSQVGVGVESEYGTYVEPDRFYEFVSETLERRPRRIQSDAIRAAGRGLRRGRRRVEVGRDGGGDLVLDVGPDLFGTWFEHALGSVATAQPDDVGAPTVYDHTFTMGSLRNKSLTVQKGVEDTDEVVSPFAFLGCKVAQLQLGITVDQFLRATVGLDAQDVVRTQPLAAATFVDGRLFHFQQATLSLDGTPVADVSSAELTLTNPMRTDRYYLGNAGLKKQPYDNGYPELAGSLTADWTGPGALYTSFEDDVALSLELKFVGAEIVDGFNEELTISAGEIRLDGETPKVSGPEIPTLTVPWSAFSNETDPDLQIVLRNTDATA
jgi:hypothetical protein